MRGYGTRSSVVETKACMVEEEGTGWGEKTLGEESVGKGNYDLISMHDSHRWMAVEKS